MQASSLVNADSKPYWDAARDGRLVLQHCDSCGRTQFPPRHMCAHCWNASLRWVESPGRGTVESVTVVHRAPTPAFRAKVPYVVASVMLDEDIRMITNIVGTGALEAAIGDTVGVTFDTETEPVLPQFRRVEG